MSRFVPGITVVVPTIAPRQAQLHRAMASVMTSIGYLADRAASLGLPHNFEAHATIVHDDGRSGAAKTRHAGLMGSRTSFTAFLDDDDEMLPDHLYALLAAALKHGADYVWSRFRIQYPDGSVLSGPAFLGKKAFSPWNDDDPCQTTVTTLVNTGLAQSCGGFAQFEETGELVDGHRRGEDHEFTLRMRDAGALLHHVPEVTWIWHHWGEGKPGVPGNTSGMPDRW